MNVDIHSHFFPIEAFQSAGQFRDKAPQVVLQNGRCTVSSGGGKRGNLAPGSYDAVERIKDLDRMSIYAKLYASWLGNVRAEATG